MNTLEITLEKWSPDLCNGFDSAKNYMGSTFYDYYVILGQNRDSDALTKSNFEVIQKQIPELECVRFGHWAYGWYELLILPIDSPMEVLQKAQAMVNSLDDYPVLDEIHFRNLERDEGMESWEIWGKSDTLKNIERMLDDFLFDGDISQKEYDSILENEEIIDYCLEKFESNDYSPCYDIYWDDVKEIIEAENLNLYYRIENGLNHDEGECTLTPEQELKLIVLQEKAEQEKAGLEQQELF